MSRTLRSIKGLIADQGVQVVSLGLVFFTTPLLLKHLGSQDYGYWMTVMQFLGYIGLVDPGLGLQITRTVAGAAEERELRSFLPTTFYIQCSLAVCFVVAGGVGAWFFARKISLPVGHESPYWWTYGLAVGVGAVGVLVSYFVSVLAGRQRLIESSLLSAVQPVVGLALGAAAVAAGAGLLALPLAALLAVLGALGSAYVLARRHEPRLSLSPALVSRAELPRLAGFSFYFQMTKLAFVVLMNTPALVIALVLGPAAVAAYTVSVRLAQTGGALIARAANIAYPGVAELLGKGDFPALQRVLVNLQFNAARVGLWFAFVVYLLNEQFVRLWVGPDLYSGRMFTLVVCGMVVRDAIVRATGVVLFASGDVRVLGLMSLVEAVLIIPLTYLLTQMVGVSGAVLGPLLATMLVISPYSLARAARIARMPVRQLLWQGLGRVLIRSVPAGVVLWWLATRLPVAWGWGWLISVGLMAAVVNVAAFDLPALWRSRDQSWSERLRALLEAR